MSVVSGIINTLDTPAVYFLVGVGILYLGSRSVWWGVGGFGRTISVWRNEPIPIGDAYLADGTIEVEGTAETLSETVSANYSNTDCFAYSYTKKRKKRTKDSDGDWETNTTTLDSGSSSVPFRITDETGSIPVDPSEATIGMDTEYRRSTGNRRSVTGKKVRTEKRIDPGDELHIIGQKRPASEIDTDLDGSKAFIGDGDDAPTFRITEGSELETVVRMFARSVGAVCLGFGLAAVGLYLVALALQAQFGLGVMALAIAANL